MAYLNTQIRDGALYCNITPSVLNQVSQTPLCHIPIDYSDCWKTFGEIFKREATSNCPVNTGALRNSIDFYADEGGVECWSDATYSAYQEYGTYRARPHSYFEKALQVAYEETKDSFETKKNLFLEIDMNFSFLLRGCTGGLSDCYYYIDKIDETTAICQKVGLKTSLLSSARASVMTRIAQIQSYQAAMQSFSFFTLLFSTMLSTLVSSVLLFPFDSIWYGTEKTHHPSH